MHSHFARLRVASPLISLLVAFFAEVARAQPEAVPPLPLKRVVLFSSSVGFFEHAGQVEGNKQIEFSFKTADVNDLLKSLVVQDRDGGLVTAVNYGSPEPVAATLRTFAIDLTESPSLAGIFRQLRGERVELQAPGSITGTIVGVEIRKVSVGDQEYADVEVLNLRTEAGLQSVRMESISRTQFLNEKIDREFQQALDMLAAAHSQDKKLVKLDFRGAGKRNVSVGYIQEAPVWKTSYRLVFKDGAPPFLQGWAIVENTTAQDWKDVQLTLVSGRPISFLMDLYQPLFMTRPFVVPEQHASLQPRVYDQDLASREQQFEGAAAAGRAARGGGGSFGGAMGGGGGFFGGAAPAAPREQRPFVTSVIPVIDGGGAIDLSKGVASAAMAEDVGELFRYVIKSPVTLARAESAMLPIVNDAVKGEKVDIYNPAVHAKHPLAGFRLTNTTALHLLQGPITLFDGGEYAGDARIEDVPPASTRLISYALDLETEVAVETKPSEQVIVALHISKGGLHVKHKVTRPTHYVVKNSSGHAKQVIIERPITADWKVVQPQSVEKTRSLQRFSLKAEPGQPATLIITEERDLREDFVLTSLTPAQLTLYVSLKAASPAMKKTLEEALAKKTAVEDAHAKRLAGDQRMYALSGEQDRIRQNLRGVSDVKTDDPFGITTETKKLSQELLKRYLTKLAEFENELDKERANQTKLREEEARANQELETLFKDLIVDPPIENEPHKEEADAPAEGALRKEPAKTGGFF